MNKNRKIILAIAAAVATTVTILLNVYQETENEIGYGIDGDAASFDFTNNTAKVRITMDSIHLHSLSEKPEQFTISLASDDKLQISSFKYGDAVGGTHEIIREYLPEEILPGEFIDVYLLKQYSDIENVEIFTNVESLSIKTDWLLINPLQDATASITSETISVFGNSHDLAFPDSTSFSMSIPKGSTEYYIVFSNDAEVIIDGIQPTPVGGWNNKAVMLTLDLNGLRSISAKGNFFVMSDWESLKISWGREFNFKIHDISGELSIDKPKVNSIDLARADDVKIQNAIGDITINKLEDTFKIYSRGIAKNIMHNEQNILEEKLDIVSMFSNPLIIGVIAVSGTGASVIALLFRRSSGMTPSITIRQNQNGNQFTIVSIQNVGNASAKNVNCRITNRTTGETAEVNPMALTPNQAINIPAPDRLTGTIGDELQIEFEYTDISGKRRRRRQRPFVVRRLTQRTQTNNP